MVNNRKNKSVIVDKNNESQLSETRSAPLLPPSESQQPVQNLSKRKAPSKKSSVPVSPSKSLPQSANTNENKKNEDQGEPMSTNDENVNQNVKINDADETSLLNLSKKKVSLKRRSLLKAANANENKKDEDKSDQIPMSISNNDENVNQNDTINDADVTNYSSILIESNSLNNSLSASKLANGDEKSPKINKSDLEAAVIQLNKSNADAALTATDIDKKKVEDYDFNVGDIVWGKITGYDYWPSRIEGIDDSTQKNSTPNSRGKSNTKKQEGTGRRLLTASCKEYRICFFGVNKQISFVTKENLKPYDCPKKSDYKKKSVKNPKLKTAIEEAERVVNKEIFFDATLSLNGESKISNNLALMSIDEELKIINSSSSLEVASNVNNTINDKIEDLDKQSVLRNDDCSIVEEEETGEKSEKTNLLQPDNDNNNQLLKSNNDDNDSLNQSVSNDTSLSNMSCRAKRSRASIANYNLSSNRKPKSEKCEIRQKIFSLTGKELENVYESSKKQLELVKSITAESMAIGSFAIGLS